MTNAIEWTLIKMGEDISGMPLTEKMLLLILTSEFILSLLIGKLWHSLTIFPNLCLPKNAQKPCFRGPTWRDLSGVFDFYERTG